MNQIDLTNCDREPIHILGSVQPFGFLLAISPDWMVRHHSENAAEFLGNPVELGAPAQELLGAAASGSIRRHIQRLRDADAVERIFNVPVGANKTPMDISIHHSGGSLVIECEPTVA